ncbi:MAG: nuclear transport factor 2 family protein [Actinomycetota bacterium]|uniref:nuclear transport factor 2 family protein n=1 Tax=Pseudonocardia sp. DR1-2 TaxID=2951168 RepID=UPI0020440D2C|nr:nuclear transport factor 2 family protein [Pseudonocardia sp. DR1-2]MCM3849078.1 nuclear transport factor 2 family protein [Pseudonocardia sp. DR1-2]
MVIVDYYSRLDGAEPLRGLDLVEPDIEFLIALPGGEVTGSGRADLAAYISGRPPVGRRHGVLRSSVDGDLEMVYGVVTEQDGRRTGAFSGVALVSPGGLIARYQVFFHPSFSLYPQPEAAA